MFGKDLPEKSSKQPRLPHRTAHQDQEETPGLLRALEIDVSSDKCFQRQRRLTLKIPTRNNYLHVYPHTGAQYTNTIESPSAFLTPQVDFQPKIILLAETTHCSYSTTSFWDPQLVVLGSPTHGSQIEDKDQESDIFSIIDTETRKEADHFHRNFFSAE